METDAREEQKTLYDHIDMSRICIVMPYYDRQFQLNKTLNTIAESKHHDFSVIIVDDCSPIDIVLPETSYEIEIIKLRNKTWTNCAPVYNTGFNRAMQKNPDIIIIQSAECYHAGDIISYADLYSSDYNYIAFGCFQIDKETTFKEHNIIDLANTNRFKVNGDNHGLGVNAWWNHPVYNVVPQYWCCAITAINLCKLNGIDERFAHGYAYEDGYFIHQVRKLGLEIEITEYPFVAHQWHKREYPPNTVQLVKRNLDLCEELMTKEDFVSQHIITPDL